MIPISEVKVSEIAKITGQDKSIISKHFKNYPEGQVSRVNNRVVGITPEAVNEFINNAGFNYFEKSAVILLANICGGVGKSTGTNNITAGLRRITNRNDPIIAIDCDPQASFTKHVFGETAKDTELLLIDFLEGRASLEDILTPLDNQIWFLKSNLNQAFIERVLSKPQDIKNSMLRFYRSVFDKFGPKTKIIQDHNPSLNTILASSICAIHQLNPDILRALLIPMRSDNYAVSGAQKVLRELEILTNTFSLSGAIHVHCYFSCMDNRISTIKSVLNKTNENQEIVKNLSEVIIRFSDEIHKSIATSTNVYTRNSRNKAAEDYNELINYIFSYKALQ
jgi:cellulose biosynthesis protein BcsQ